MKKQVKIGVLGFGNMGGSIAKALAKEPDFEVWVYDEDKKKTKAIKRLKVAKSSKSLIENTEVLILSIKPQDVAKFLTATKSIFLKKKILLVTIVAGLSTKVFQNQIEGLKVIRVMPNLAVKVGESVSFMCKGKFAKKSDLEITKKIFSCIGEGAIVSESYIDKATSISGSGPGYVFYFMDAVYNQAVKLGFSKDDARQMVAQTFFGAAKLAKESDVAFEKLVKGVASKGGTTEAAVKHLDDAKFEEILGDAIEKAYKRAKELNE